MSQKPSRKIRDILVLGGGAAGLAAAIAARQAGGGGVRVSLLEQNPAPGKKLLATGNGRCNLDNLASSDPERYFSADPARLAALLGAIDAAKLPDWLAQLGLVTRADEAGRLYPYSNQAADLVGLLRRWVEALGVRVLAGCRVLALGRQGRRYLVEAETGGERQRLAADGVICALGGSAGPQFGTGGFGPALAGRCGGRIEPLYPCLTPLRCAGALPALAGLRARGAAALYDGERLLAREAGEVQFTEYGLSGICVMQLSGLLTPQRGPKAPRLLLDLFPDIGPEALAALFARRAAQLPGDSAAAFWQGLLAEKLGAALWTAAGLSACTPGAAGPEDWQALAAVGKGWDFGAPSLCGWKQAQATGGGLALREVDADFRFRGCPGLYFVGETLDCAGSCGGFNLHWAFGSGLVAGRAAAQAGGSGG